MGPERHLKCHCRHCENPIEFPYAWRGHAVACPHCGQETELTAADVLPQGAVGGTVAYRVGDLRPVPPASIGYRVAMGWVAGMLVLMPLVYAGVLGGVLYLVYYWAAHAWTWFARWGSLFRAVFYLVPILVGVAVGWVLMAPFLRRRAPPPQSLALNPEAEPALYAFIQEICAAVGAPPPVRVDLDCQLNAAAGYRLGPLHSREMVLTLGLPLVGALDLRQFAGVLAHEFGHFRQRSGMRLSGFVRRWHFWFAEFLYRRTPWQDAVDENLEEGHGAAGAFLMTVAVGLARLPLRLVFVAGLATSAHLLRQMEKDADRCEIELAGSPTFESTIRRLRVLQRALRRTYDAVHGMWTQRRGVPDDFCALLLKQESEMPVALRAKLERDLGELRSGWLDSHPSDAARVAMARSLNLEGGFQGAGRARHLFSNFDAVARQVSILHYREDLGFPVVDGMFLPGAPHGGQT